MKLFNFHFCRFFIAAILVVMCFPAVAAGDGINTPFVNPDSYTSLYPALNVQYDGTNLYIAANDGAGTEMCYWFKHCMANNLFTFFRVGYRQVDRNYSSAVGISKLQGVKVLNSTGSDNIGPVAIAGYADFVGGNHRWRTPDDNGNPGKGTYIDVRTANTDSYTIKVDGTVLLPGQERMGTTVTVDVHNTLYDPLIAPADSDVILSSPLINEVITYTVTGNSIAVDAEHTYEKSFTVSRYYGMQSMFVSEDSVMTPGGAYPTFTGQSSVKTFYRQAYPDFCRFIEHNVDGWCQSAWMRPRDLGTHYALQGNSPIFARGSYKCYHVLMNAYAVTPGDTSRWHGIYTWALPIVNDDDLIVYKGVADNRQVIYITAKRACERAIPRPTGAFNASMQIEETSPDMTIYTSADSLYISAQGRASAILKLRLEGDANLDDVVNSDDIEYELDIIYNRTKLKEGGEVNADVNGDNDIDVTDITRIIDIIGS